MNQIHCHTCGKTMGFSEREGVLRNRVFCSPYCLVFSNDRMDQEEERNDLWYWMTRRGRSPIYVAKMFGVSNTLVYKAVNRRKALESVV